MTDFEFPKGFLWGVASSPSQVEDNLLNDWAEFFERIGAFSPRHLEMFDVDLGLMIQMGVNSYRFGIDWARLQQSPNRQLDTRQVEVYRSMLLKLKVNKIKAIVTLHHFANPLWLPKEMWKNNNTVEYFVDFAAKCLDEFDDLVWAWNLINEPEVYELNRYIVGVFPPNKKWALFSAMKELINMKRAVCTCYPIFKEKGATVISIAKNLRLFHSLNGTTREKCVSSVINVLYNDWIFNNFFFFKGKPITDMIGINYYGPTRIDGWLPFLPGIKARTVIDKEGVFDDIQEIKPSSIIEALEYVQKRTTLPIIILENGVGTRDDEFRSRVILEQLKWLARSIQGGVDVRGYFHWSLIDNIEWNLGNTVQFGLIEFDKSNNFKRKVKGSGLLFASLCRNNRVNLPPD